MNRRSIVWITLESARQDHTSLAGHTRDTTPTLQRLAARPDGTAYMNCFSHGIWTRTSTASVLTGRAPSDHGVLSFDSKLPDAVRTIPERLSNSGYRTACVSPIAQVSEATGLDRGFDAFHYLGIDTLLEEAGPLTLLRYLSQLRHHSAGFTTETKKHCIGYLVAAIAKRHIRQAGRTDQPLFLYTHLSDSHHAYYPPRGWRDRFADDLTLPLDDALAVAMDMSDNLVDHMAEGVPFSDAEWNAIEVMYDTCLRYVDSLAGDIADHAQRHLDDPIVVVTGDHGELLGERGCLAHMLVANTAVSHVPLVISGVDGLSCDGQLVQHADVMSLLADECGLSLSVPVGVNPRSASREIAVTQRGGARARKKLRMLRDANPDYDASRFHEGDLTSVRTADYRYQRSEDREELFELPDETTDRSEVRPEATERFRKLTEAWLDEHGGSAVETRAEFSDRMEQQLEDLGYL